MTLDATTPLKPNKLRRPTHWQREALETIADGTAILVYDGDPDFAVYEVYGNVHRSVLNALIRYGWVGRAAVRPEIKAARGNAVKEAYYIAEAGRKALREIEDGKP